MREPWGLMNVGPNRAVTTPPIRAPVTIAKNPTSLETAAISSSENPSEM